MLAGSIWARERRCLDNGRKKIRHKKCLTRTKSTSTGPIRFGTVGMRRPRCRGRGQDHGPALEEALQDSSPVPLIILIELLHPGVEQCVFHIPEF